MRAIQPFCPSELAEIGWVSLVVIRRFPVHEIERNAQMIVRAGLIVKLPEINILIAGARLGANVPKDVIHCRCALRCGDSGNDCSRAIGSRNGR